MRHDDPLANNLLARLFSYTPREGREPLEDFCTETLAWCLRANSEFCKSFLRLFKLDYQPDLKMETQLEVNGKRFDLTISSYKGNFLVILENKVWSDFGNEQLQNYRKIIDRQFREEFANRHIATITPYSNLPIGADKHCTWSQVQRLMAEFENHNDKELQFVCSWFAKFLAHQGLKPMKIEIQKIQNYFEGFQLREDMKNFLESLRKNKRLESLLKGNQIRFNDKADDLWLEIVGNEIQDSCFAFQLHKSPPAIYVYAECSLAGDKQKLFETLKKKANWGSQLKSCEFVPKTQKTWISFHKPLDEDFCTDDKMREWFIAIAAFMRDDLNKTKYSRSR